MNFAWMRVQKFYGVSLTRSGLNFYRVPQFNSKLCLDYSRGENGGGNAQLEEGVMTLCQILLHIPHSLPPNRSNRAHTSDRHT